jgi:predicted transcriptional regulator
MSRIFPEKVPFWSFGRVSISWSMVLVVTDGFCHDSIWNSFECSRTRAISFTPALGTTYFTKMDGLSRGLMHFPFEWEFWSSSGSMTELRCLPCTCQNIVLVRLLSMNSWQVVPSIVNIRTEDQGTTHTTQPSPEWPGIKWLTTTKSPRNLTLLTVAHGRPHGRTQVASNLDRDTAWGLREANVITGSYLIIIQRSKMDIDVNQLTITIVLWSYFHIELIPGECRGFHGLRRARL